MRFFAPVIFAILLFSCKVSKVDIIKCTSQNWRVISSSQSGTVYHIVTRVKSGSEDLKFDSIEINNIVQRDFHYSTLGKSNNDKNFVPGDSVLISFNRITETPLQIKENGNFIHYACRNKRYKKKIKTIIEITN